LERTDGRRHKTGSVCPARGRPMGILRERETLRPVGAFERTSAPGLAGIARCRATPRRPQTLAARRGRPAQENDRGTISRNRLVLNQGMKIMRAPEPCPFSPTSHGLGRDAFHSVPDFIPQSKVQFQGRGGTRPSLFMERTHDSETMAASHEPDGRASLSPASRVGRNPRTSSGSPGRTRPTGFKGRMQRSEIKGASPEPFLRTAAFRPLQRWTPEGARKQPEGCGPHGFRFIVHGPEAKKASHELTPSPFPLPIRWGEGVRRTGEGAVRAAEEDQASVRR